MFLDIRIGKNRNFSLFIRYESTKRSPKSPLCWSLWVKFFKVLRKSWFQPFSTGSFGDYKLPESTVTPLIQDYDQKIPKFRLAWSQNASFLFSKKSMIISLYRFGQRKFRKIDFSATGSPRVENVSILRRTTTPPKRGEYIWRLFVKFWFSGFRIHKIEISDFFAKFVLRGFLAELGAINHFCVIIFSVNQLPKLPCH